MEVGACLPERRRSRKDVPVAALAGPGRG